ncbi:acyltransferase family protein [Mariprofundus ferrooxydans]|uniref:Predicted acyltransferase n=1 Tax=Mariprofundus ferrooxydans PV-1 TaxID=314345 RepID=Q0EZA9_9PROT|nr:acyltransferase [Mariprofundus ferrooxydans]EAU54515.1 Predicted acyltransferase [Mariprofundus ferrooxydans PV-1]
MGLIRTLLALSVVLVHVPGYQAALVGGQFAVQLFYMISGYLISYILVENKRYEKISDFYFSRYLRLYPVYFVVALLTLLTYLMINSSYFGLYASLPWQASTELILSNTFLFGQDYVMFSAIKNGALVFASNFQDSEVSLWAGLLVPQAWTLGLELSFYLIAPFILHSRKLLIGLLLLSLSLRAYLISIGIGLNDPWTYRFFPTELLFFILGALSHQFLSKLYSQWFEESRLKKAAMVSTLAFVAYLLIFPYIPNVAGVGNIAKISMLFVLFFFALPFFFTFQNMHKLDGKIGDLSYPIYISHVLVIFVLGSLFDRDIISRGFPMLATVAACIVFAFMLDTVVSKKVELIRVRFKAKA